MAFILAFDCPHQIILCQHIRITAHRDRIRAAEKVVVILIVIDTQTRHAGCAYRHRDLSLMIFVSKPVV
jgi:hypothetical protein